MLLFSFSPVRVCSVSYFLSLLDFQLPLKGCFPKAYKLLKFQPPFKRKQKQAMPLLNCLDPPPPTPPSHLRSTAKFLEKNTKAQCMYALCSHLALPHWTVLTILVFLKNLSLFFFTSMISHFYYFSSYLRTLLSILFADSFIS